MPRLHLNVKTIARLKPSAAGQVEYFDADTPGLALRVNRDGSKTWRVHLSVGAHRVRRVSLGAYPAVDLETAQRDARTLRDAHRAGQDAPPALTARPTPATGDTFGALADLYLERYADRRKSERSAAEDRRQLRAYLLPHWRTLRVDQITRRVIMDRLHAIATDGSSSAYAQHLRARTIARAAVAALEADPTLTPDRATARALEAMPHRGAPVAANRVAALVSKLFAFAVDAGWIDASPAFRLTPPTVEASRDRVLTDDEIRDVWHRCHDDPAPRHTAAFLLALATGKRIGEILSAEWSEIDTRTGWYDLPGRRTKNGLDDRVALNRTARATLLRLKAAATSPIYVFPTTAGDRPIDKESRPYRGALQRIFRPLAPPARPHDLRRTVATNLGRLGYLDAEIALVLNHTRTDVTAIYNRHAYDERKRAMLDKWDRELRRIVSGRPASRHRSA